MSFLPSSTFDCLMHSCLFSNTTVLLNSGRTHPAGGLALCTFTPATLTDCFEKKFLFVTASCISYILLKNFFRVMLLWLKRRFLKQNLFLSQIEKKFTKTRWTQPRSENQFITLFIRFTYFLQVHLIYLISTIFAKHLYTNLKRKYNVTKKC